MAGSVGVGDDRGVLEDDLPAGGDGGFVRPGDDEAGWWGEGGFLGHYSLVIGFGMGGAGGGWPFVYIVLLGWLGPFFLECFIVSQGNRLLLLSEGSF